MKRIGVLFFAAVLCLHLSGCAGDSQNTYSTSDIGHETSVEYGRVVKVKAVRIQGKDSGAGVLVGGAAGAGLGNAIASGGGRPGGAIIGLIAGAIAGGVAEHQLQNQKGIEYTIVKHNGKTVMIVQTIAKDDEPIHRGEHVIIQTSGHYQRVLPADDLPDSVKRPKEIQVED